MISQIYLIRHGETEWSLSGRHTGRTDLPLTKNGERVAAGLRGRLKGISFTHVLTSPLQRARRTCELAGFGTVAQVDPALHEWDYGDYEGKTSTEIHALRPDWNIFTDGCPNGETTRQISDRADNVLGNLRSLEGTVALFSHGQFLRILAMRWVGIRPEEARHFAFDAASVSILGTDRHSGDAPVISLWNSGAESAP